MPPRVAQYPIKDAEVEDLEKLERIIKNLCDAGLKIEGGKCKIGKVPRVPGYWDGTEIVEGFIEKIL